MAFNPRRLIPLVVLGALIGAGMYVERVRSAQRSSLSGVFEAQPATLASRIGGRVSKILVEEGQFVKAGTKLVEFEAENDQAQSEATRAQANAANAQARDLSNGARPEDIARQAAVVRELEANVQKLQHGALPEEVAIARQRWNAAQARAAEVATGARPEERRAAQAALREAEARYRIAQRGLTPEERNQLDAAYGSAQADAQKAVLDAQRAKDLFDQGAISRSQWELAETRARTASLRATQAHEALLRAQRGTPTEELEAARQAFTQAEARYDAINNGSRPEDIRQARADAEQAHENYLLVARGARSEDIAAAKARLAQAQANLNLLRNGNRTQQIEAAKASARAAESLAKGSNQNLEERTVTAPKDGIIERNLVQVGDLVNRGAPVIRFSDPEDIWLRVYVPERALAQINRGSAATLHVDGIEGNVEGVVESIATQGEFTPANLQTAEERGKQVFAVRIRLKQPDPKIKAGMAASVMQIGDFH